MQDSFGSVCKVWRKSKRYSQMQLALELNISSKHICFIETGRSAASKEMVLKIGTFLELPKREINRGLHAAGFAPQFPQWPLEHETLSYVSAAIDVMLDKHMPFPGLVIDAEWDLVQSNPACAALFDEIGFSGQRNLAEAIAQDDPATSKIINWHETIAAVLSRLQQETSTLGSSARLKDLQRQLSAVIAEHGGLSASKSSPAFILELSAFSQHLKFFSVVAQLGSVQDVAVSEFKIELMFPADETTRDFYSANV